MECKQGNTCYGIGQDYEGCGNGYCLNRPHDPKKTCHCPYVPPKPKPAVCKQGQECGKPFSKRNAEVCGNGECIWDCTSHPCVIMSNQKFVYFFMNFNSHANLKGFGLASLSGACRDTVIGISSVTNKQTNEKHPPKVYVLFRTQLHICNLMVYKL